MSDNNLELHQRLMVLWGKAQPIVAAYIHSVIWNSHDADDIVQEVVGVIVVQFEQYDKDRSFTAWAMGISRNKVREYCRARARDPLVFSENTAEVLATHFAEHHTELSQARLALKTCLARIDASARRLVELRYTSNLKPGVIADRIGVSANTIRIRLHRIRQALESCIRQILITKGATV